MHKPLTFIDNSWTQMQRSVKPKDVSASWVNNKIASCLYSVSLSGWNGLLPLDGTFCQISRMGCMSNSWIWPCAKYSWTSLWKSRCLSSVRGQCFYHPTTMLEIFHLEMHRSPPCILLVLQCNESIRSITVLEIFHNRILSESCHTLCHTPESDLRV